MKLAVLILILFSAFLPSLFSPVASGFSTLGSPARSNQNTTGQEVYVANFNEFQRVGSLSVINDSTNKIIHTIKVGSEPSGGAYDPVNKELYVVDYDSSYVTVVNSTDNKVIKTITMGDPQPVSAAFDSHNGEVYVANYCTACTSGSTVSVINTTKNNVITNIAVGSEPTAAVFNPSNDELYVPSVGADAVYVIKDSTNKVITTMNDCFTEECIDAPLAAALNSANNELYVANFNDNAVAVYNCKTNTFVKLVSVGSGPDGAAYSPSNEAIYIANNGANSVSVINLKNKDVALVEVGSQPNGLGFDSDNGEMYVANYGSNTVTVINCMSNKVIKTVAVGNEPIGIVVS